MQAIIGTIGDIDSYQLPDSKGYTAFMRHVLGVTDEERQQRRDEILGTTIKDFRCGQLRSKLRHAGREGYTSKDPARNLACLVSSPRSVDAQPADPARGSVHWAQLACHCPCSMRSRFVYSASAESLARCWRPRGVQTLAWWQ